MDFEALIKHISVVIFLIFIINILLKFNEVEEKKGKETILPIIIYFLIGMVFLYILSLIFNYLGLPPLDYIDRNEM